MRGARHPLRRSLWFAALLVAGGCASTSGDPFAASAPVETVSEKRTCPVDVENATGYSLDIRYQAGTLGGRLLDVAPGESYTVGVPCALSRVSVFAVGPFTQATGLIRFRKSAPIERSGAPTRLRLTAADKMRGR